MRKLVEFTIFIVLLAGVSLWNYEQSSRAERALCAVREDRLADIAGDQRRVQRLEKYIVDIKTGQRKPIPGITLRDINDNIAEVQNEINDHRQTARHIQEHVGC